MDQVSRRTLLAGSMVAAATAALPRRAAAAAPFAGRQAPGFYRYKIGDLEITALYEGVWQYPLDDKFVRGAAHDDVKKEMADAFLPQDKVIINATAMLINTGSKLVLLDTGTGGQLAPTAGLLTANLAAAGIDPKSIDMVVISHFHADHINGIKTKDNQLAFPNAEISVPAPEWDFWMDEGKMSAAPERAQGNFRNVRRVFGDIAKNVKRYEPGKEIAPGIASLAAFGHTPGHMAFVVASGKDSLLAMSDAAVNSILFVRHPEWSPIFDMDHNTAVETRKRLLDQAAADRMRIAAYHFPFPASGFIARRGAGYEFVPAMWQPAL